MMDYDNDDGNNGALTIGQLIKLLSTYDESLPIFAEGCQSCMHPVMGIETYQHDKSSSNSTVVRIIINY